MLVEDTPECVQKVAAYVDLNAVRAGIVKDPKDYRFCGYAEAAARDGLARRGLASCLKGATWKEQHQGTDRPVDLISARIQTLGK